METPRSFDDICAELFRHPDFVIGNMLSREHVRERGFDPDALGDMEWAADPISETMWECIAEEAGKSE